MRRAPLRRSALVLALICPCVACEERKTHEITITDGATTTRLTTQSEFAEYVALPGDHNELRLTLASYQASCDRWVPPADGQTLITVVIVLPPETSPAPGAYGWSGIPTTDEPLRASYALPKAHFGSRARLFEPGGAVRLTQVQLDAHGSVAGTLAFEFPGEADRPATRIDGNFEAHVCRVSLPAR
jgi:hypothetical protein